MAAALFAEAVAEPGRIDSGLGLDIPLNSTAGSFVCMYIEKTAKK
jgi:hypothetical protein